MTQRESLIMSAIILFFLFAGLTNANGEKCLPTSFHKMRSSPANTEYLECKAWSSDTCCTANFTTQLNKTRLRDLYGFHWGHCKNISQKCERFLLDEECFYQCEPRLYRWHVANGTIKNVPICGDFCNAWYEACKDDETCVENWVTGFNYSNSMYSCPNNSVCRTFAQWYGSGEGLCNKMWGTSFRYVDPKCPCSRMDGPIPANVNENSTCSAGNTISQLTWKWSFQGLYLILFVIVIL
ncbi:riboflavin-binding protein-like [Xenia sp. Carnegie-2017]|uniref:riboflavin-binding protein-like n=1 Tax=Xenia sp. Carnegie-2017 TaxID=2897299 RepID=UPI001F04E443|nr:riboflavin-binding protein-like [Xenia sp. Carnegie-2017]